jgi:hypothetical protein
MLTSHMLKYNSGGCSSFNAAKSEIQWSKKCIQLLYITRTIFLAIAMLTFCGFSRNHISYCLRAGLRSAFIPQPPRQLTAAPSPSLPTQVPTTAGGLALSSFKGLQFIKLSLCHRAVNAVLAQQQPRSLCLPWNTAAIICPAWRALWNIEHATQCTSSHRKAALKQLF